MSTIHRYIIFDLLRSFFFALFVFTAILVLLMAAREMLMHNVPPILVLRMIPYFLPELLRYSIPMTLLLATTTFFARMSGANEITALKALGIPPWRILTPVYIVGIVVSLLTVWINDFAVTYGKDGIARVFVTGAEDYIYGNLRTNRILAPKGSGFSITVKGVENKRLLNPTIRVQGTSITAQSAEISMDHANEKLTFVLHNLLTENGSGIYVSGQRYEETVALSDIIPSYDTQKTPRPSDMKMDRIPSEIDQQIVLQKVAKNRMAAQTAFTVCLGNYAGFSSPDWANYYFEESSIQNNLNRLHLEPPRRWSSGFSCFFFVWVGAPFAIWMKKSDIFASFFACFIPILILYYPLLMLGTEWGKNGTLPPPFIWSGNVALGLIGLYFFRIIHKH